MKASDDSLERKFIQVAATLGFLAVAFGAFGAHALKTSLPSSGLEVWKTAVFYQLTHAIVLLIVAAAGQRLSRLWRIWSLRLFTLGVVLFSGSLYLLTLSQLKWLGMITPVGGLLLLAAWLCVFIGAFRRV